MSARFVNMPITYPMIPSGHLFASTGPLKRAGLQTEDNVNTRSIFQLNRSCGGWKPPAPPKAPQSHTSSSPDVLSDAISASLLLFVACNDVHASVPDVVPGNGEVEPRLE